MPVPATVCVQDAELSPVFFLRASALPGTNVTNEQKSAAPALTRGFAAIRDRLGLPGSSCYHLIATLREVRARGWAFDDEEDLPNIRCMAAPVRDMQGQVVAAISAVGTVLDISRERIAELAATLCATANEISQHLGHPAADGRAAAGR